MASAAEWLARSDWALRSGEFGALLLAEDERRKATGRVPAMDFGSAGSTVQVSEPCWELWRDLPNHPHLVAALSPGIVSYAAIDWQPSVATDAQLATWAIDLAHLFELVIGRTRELAGWLSCPIAKVDLDREVRVLFATAGRESLPLSVVPPEIVGRWPFANERAFVFSVGQCLVQLGAQASAGLRPLVARCLDPDPGARFATLDALTVALREHGAAKRVRANLRRPRWQFDAIEQGLGLLALGEPWRASQSFEGGFSNKPISAVARELHSIAKQQLEQLRAQEAPPSVARGEPPKMYSHVYAVANGQIARSRIELGRPPLEVLAQPATFDAIVERDLRAREYRRALERIDERFAADPESPRLYHMRGKALLALGRLGEARAAFDLALAQDPRLLEAMLLRREVDRTVANARDAVGTSGPMKLGLPETLTELRDIFVTGRVVDAIQMLRRSTYDDDRTAQLLLAELLVTDERHDEALAIFDRFGDALGKARALLALARPAEALAALEGCDADDALELRSRILRALGRGDDADRAMDAYLRAVERRSDRRLHAQ